MKTPLQAYATAGHRNVQGWLSETAIDLLLALVHVQRAQGIGGPVCEIGVHHGRLFILLHLLTDGSEQSVAWDLFENQDENLGRSGKGDRNTLMSNLSYHGADLSRIQVHTANSLTLSADDVVRACGACPRIFSIDGGHTAEITVHDLTLAAKSSKDDGLIVLDDFFNEPWPGVAEGACRYQAHPPVPLFPVAIGGNKFIFTKSKAAAAVYRDGLAAVPGELYQRRDTRVFDQDVVVFTRRPAKVRLLRRLRKTLPWRAAKRLRRAGARRFQRRS